MMHHFLRPFAAALLLWTGAASAQLPVVSGERLQAAQPKAAATLRLESLAKDARTLALPEVGADEVALVRGANAATGFKHVRRVVIGLTRATGEAVEARTLRWARVEGGFAARAAVHSPDAGSLRMGLELAGVPADVELAFFGSADPTRVEGPIRVGDIADRSRTWWSPLTEGETQTVEIFVPAAHDARALPLAVAGASHIFTTPSSRFAKRVQDIGAAGSCNVDLPCSPLNGQPGFAEAVASVAQMVYTEGRFTALCTGTLLADADPATQVPWFYSANHCFDNPSAPFKSAAEMQAVASTVTTLWSFQAGACNGGTPVAHWSQLAGGATFLHGNPQSDVLFLRLHGTPPAGAYFSGWDANPLASGTPVIAIHHPQGDLKKVTQGSVAGFAVPGVADGVASFAATRWSSGTTEPGSSGSGIWTSNGGELHFRGGLWGGDALCSNPSGTDNYSRLDHAYGALAQYLGGSGAAIDYTDLWWGGEAESGWGLNLIQHPSRVIFGVWYTYDADGKRTWYVLPGGAWTDATTYTGPLYATAGPGYAGAFDPAVVKRTQVGTATLTFRDRDNGTFAFSVDGVSGSKAISRQPF